MKRREGGRDRGMNGKLQSDGERESCDVKVRSGEPCAVQMQIIKKEEEEGKLTPTLQAAE